MLVTLAKLSTRTDLLFMYLLCFPWQLPRLGSVDGALLQQILDQYRRDSDGLDRQVLDDKRRQQHELEVIHSYMYIVQAVMY